jgi:hypothetical protein
MVPSSASAQARTPGWRCVLMLGGRTSYTSSSTKVFWCARRKASRVARSTGMGNATSGAIIRAGHQVWRLQQP